MPQGMMANMPMQLPKSFLQKAVRGFAVRCHVLLACNQGAGWSIGLKSLNL